MNPEPSIKFTEASQTFQCDEYYRDNFIALLDANSLAVHAPEHIEPVPTATAKKSFLVKLIRGSQPLKQEQGDALIARFLVADDEIKARK